jgi:hypothetical protein
LPLCISCRSKFFQSFDRILVSRVKFFKDFDGVLPLIACFSSKGYSNTVVPSVNVRQSTFPNAYDFTNGTPGVLTGIGSFHFFGFFGNKLGLTHWTVGRGRARVSACASLDFESCIKQKQR